MLLRSNLFQCTLVSFLLTQFWFKIVSNVSLLVSFMKRIGIDRTGPQEINGEKLIWTGPLEAKDLKRGMVESQQCMVRT